MNPHDPHAAVRYLLGPLDGARIPGGCDHCDAYQTAAAIDDGIYRVTVHHDDDCQVIAAHEKGRPA